MRIAKKALLLAVQRGVAAGDVFSTTLYTGNGSTQTITNGIDLAGEGGLVWMKARNITYSNVLQDTVRGAGVDLYSNLTEGQINYSGLYGVDTFNNNGFSLTGAGTGTNASGNSYTSWTFRQAPKFFDIVEATTDGNGDVTFSHDLGVEPGFVVSKDLDSTGSWLVYHRSLGSDKLLFLNATNSEITATGRWGATSSTFSVNGGRFNSREIYYLFAHDPSDSGIIQCGSYTGNGSTNGPVIDLGWEPQWLLVKNADAATNWYLVDSERGFTSSADARLVVNTSGAETSLQTFDPLPTGFSVESDNVNYNGNGNTHIYIAIRTPE